MQPSAAGSEAEHQSRNSNNAMAPADLAALTPADELTLEERWRFDDVKMDSDDFVPGPASDDGLLLPEGFDILSAWKHEDDPAETNLTLQERHQFEVYMGLNMEVDEASGVAGPDSVYADSLLVPADFDILSFQDSEEDEACSKKLQRIWQEWMEKEEELMKQPVPKRLRCYRDSDS